MEARDLQGAFQPKLPDRALGLRQEARIAMIMLDTVNWPIVFLGALRAGVGSLRRDSQSRYKARGYPTEPASTRICDSQSRRGMLP